MTAGRTPIATPDVIDVEAENDQQQIAGAMTVMRADATAAEAGVRADIFRLGQMVGARQMNELAAKFLAAADISLFDEISKDKVYKHLPIRFPDGNLRPAENIQEFCKVFFNTTYSVMAENRKALEVLGSQSYEIAKNLGLKRTQLRLLINLPEDTRSLIDEAMQEGNKAKTETLILSLANQLDATRANVAELKADVAAKEARIAIKARQLDEAEATAFGFQRLPHDEQVDALLAEATNLTNAALTAISGRLRQALVALENHGQSTSGVKDFRPLAAGLVGQIQKAVTILRDEFMLDDIIGDGVPEWMRATAHLVDE